MRTTEDNEICNMCGRSVAFGSGWFVNRVPDLNTKSEREAEGRPYPEGDWICAECDERNWGWCRDRDEDRPRAGLRGREAP